MRVREGTLGRQAFRAGIRSASDDKNKEILS